MVNLTIKKNFRELRLIADALSSKKRLDILREIQRDSDCSHKSIAKSTGIAQSSVTFHMNKLIASGLVDEKPGKGLMNRKKKVPFIIEREIVINL